MKSTLLFIFLALAPLGYSQTINFPDANLKAKLLSATASNGVATGQVSTYNMNSDSWTPNQTPYYTVIDTNGDGEIQVSEALLIKTHNPYNYPFPVKLLRTNKIL